MPDVLGLVDLDQHDRQVARDPVRPQRARALRAGARARPPRAGAPGPRRGRGWRGSGRGAPRRGRCRGGAAGPAPASTPASPRGRTSPDRGTSRRDRGPRRATARRASRTRRARSRPARQPHAAPQAHDRIEHRAGRVGQRPAVDHRRRRPDPAPAAEEPRAIGLPLQARRPSRPRRPPRGPARPASRGATAAGGSPAACRARATHSVCTLRLENAGWAASAAGGASTTSAYDVSSMLPASCVPRFVSETRRTSASSSGDTITCERGRRWRRPAGRTPPDPRRT